MRGLRFEPLANCEDPEFAESWISVGVVREQVPGPLAALSASVTQSDRLYPTERMLTAVKYI